MSRTARRISSYRIVLAAGLVFGLQAAAVPSVAFAQSNPLEKGSENPLERSASAKYHGPVLDLPMRLEGDGLVLDVEDYDPATTDITGRIRLGGGEYPFTGRYADTTHLAGAFNAGGSSYDFTLEGSGDRGYTFTTGQSRYQLRDLNAPQRATGLATSDQQAGGADPGELQRAADAMSRDDFREALRIAEPLAERGHVGSCYIVGRCYEAGMGVDKDLRRAERYYLTAARGDHPAANFQLGLMYNSGALGQADNEAAVRHFQRAAELGLTNAAIAYGEMTVNGIGKQADFVEGIAWAGVAARRGNERAQSLITYYNDDNSVSREDRTRVGNRIAELERTLPDISKTNTLLDYNRFVTPVAATGTDTRRDERPQPAANTIAGTWTGIMSEQDDYGQMAQYPITIEMAQGSQGGCTADVRVDVRMPGQDGQMYDIRATARFQGSAQNGRGSMRSDNATMTVVQTGESQAMGAQQLEFTVNGNSINGRLGNDYDGWSQFQATRAGSPQGGSGGPGANTGGLGTHTPQDRPYTPNNEQSWNSDGGASTGLGRPEAARGEKTAASVTLEPVTLTDPTMGGAPSHTLLVPVGWQHTGGVKWSPPQLYQDMVHMNLRVNAPDGAGFAYYPGGSYTWSDIYQLNMQAGVPASGPAPQPGQITGDGLTFMPPPSTTGDYVQSMLFPQQHPNATDVRVLEANSMPEVLSVVREMLAPTMQMIEQNNASMRQMGGGQMTMSPFADRVHVTYTENGQRFEEDIDVTGYAMFSQMPYPFGGQSTTAYWYIEDMHAVRNPAGRDENRAIADAASLSVRPDPKWAATVMDMRAQINKTVANGIAERGRITREAMQESFNRHQEAVRAQSESNDKLHHQFINYIRDVEDYQTPGGNVVQLPSQYNNAYMNGQGQVVMTNAPLNSTSGWTQLNRVSP